MHPTFFARDPVFQVPGAIDLIHMTYRLRRLAACQYIEEKNHAQRTRSSIKNCAAVTSEDGT